MSDNFDFCRMERKLAGCSLTLESVAAVVDRLIDRHNQLVTEIEKLEQELKNR